MQEEKTKSLGTEPVGKLLLRLALPAIAAQVVNMLYNIVDRMYIGHIPEVGAAALTGVGVAFPIIMLISAFSALIGMGGAPRASIKMGQGDYEGAEEILGNCFCTLIFISIGLTSFFMLTQKQLLLVFGASENTMPYGLSYLQIYTLGTVFVQMALGLNSFISSQGFAGTSMMTVLIGAVINIVLDPIFIFVFHMGVRGAALATILSQAVSAVWVLWFLSGPKTGLRLKKKNFKVKGEIILPVLGLGVSPFIMQSTESLLNICFNTSLFRYGGDVAVGSMTILSSLMQVLMMPLMGLTQGAQPIVGFNYGANKPERVKKTFFCLLGACMAYTTLFWSVTRFAPEALVSIFTSNPDLVNAGVWAMQIYLAAGFILGAQIACQQTFIAVGQAKASLFLALLRKIILLIPFIYLFPQIFSDQVFAVFLAEPVADFIATSVTILLFAVQFRKLLKTMRAKNETA